MAVLTLAVAAVGGVLIYQVLSDDERPIRVRNGSMEILAARDTDNEWTWELEPNGDGQDGSPSYSHEPRDTYFDRDNTLWVKVVRRSGTCEDGDKTSGNLVRVEYSENNAFVTFKRGRSGWWNYRTKVRPPNVLTLVSPPVLRHGAQGSGFVSRVQVNNWSCTFPDANALDTIYICSSENRAECQ
jgi:hypothetical protein